MYRRSNELQHHGIAGQRWYHRWFQTYEEVPTRSGKVGTYHGKDKDVSQKSAGNNQKENKNSKQSYSSEKDFGKSLNVKWVRDRSGYSSKNGSIRVKHGEVEKIYVPKDTDESKEALQQRLKSDPKLRAKVRREGFLDALRSYNHYGMDDEIFAKYSGSKKPMSDASNEELAIVASKILKGFADDLVEEGYSRSDATYITASDYNLKNLSPAEITKAFNALEKELGDEAEKNFGVEKYAEIYGAENLNYDEEELKKRGAFWSLDNSPGDYLSHHGVAGQRWYHRWHQTYEQVPTRSGKVGTFHGKLKTASDTAKKNIHNGLEEGKRDISRTVSTAKKNFNRGWKEGKEDIKRLGKTIGKKLQTSANDSGNNSRVRSASIGLPQKPGDRMVKEFLERENPHSKTNPMGGFSNEGEKHAKELQNNRTLKKILKPGEKHLKELMAQERAKAKYLDEHPGAKAARLNPGQKLVSDTLRKAGINKLIRKIYSLDRKLINQYKSAAKERDKKLKEFDKPTIRTAGLGGSTDRVERELKAASVEFAKEVKTLSKEEIMNDPHLLRLHRAEFSEEEVTAAVNRLRRIDSENRFLEDYADRNTKLGSVESYLDRTEKRVQRLIRWYKMGTQFGTIANNIAQAMQAIE